eukprot:CAMPEP_0201663610 /NCGR_PEP_ID=MMETSP0494-20130426/5351_1 /ASSEMBLY_ACC=CAM_ASM_000839 /TAXON_ID=420259 /ORGANISM="Thalassiosira gravida, Strain GMp14c1" /LENGTH=522 /DNA_ID=CAMNT_0048142239 /DNA_START=113 /DNA_END=1681 /DNA_ORIENTATION=+
MKTLCKPPHRRGLMPACCIAAAMLLASPASAAETNSTESPQPSFLNRYTPSTDVDDIAALDLDQRSIVAKLASGTFLGLKEAEEIYSNGRFDAPGDDGGDGTKITVQSLSTNVEGAIKPVDSATLAMFERYYGSTDYADKWIRASIDGAETTFANGNADFSKFGLAGRAESVRYGTAVLNIWMAVVGRLETAAFLCPSFASSSIMKWDRAVALYTGSLSRATGAEGQFPYTLAQIQCKTFGTCDLDDGDTMAPLNDRIFTFFTNGQAQLENGNCLGVSDIARDARSLMTVPLVQGVLHAVYLTDNEDYVLETTQGAGAAFAAALLPLIHSCNEGNADLVHNDLMPGKLLEGSYEVVKAALERSYKCLNIQCEDVGGIMNLRGDGYIKGAEACGTVAPILSNVDYDDQVTNEVDEMDESGDEDDYGDFGYAPPPPKDWKQPQPDVKEEPEQSSESGNGSSGGDNMNVMNAALLSGLAFGILGFVGGAAITAACKRKKSKKKESVAEFVTSDEAYGGVDENEMI